MCSLGTGKLCDGYQNNAELLHACPSCYCFRHKVGGQAAFEGEAPPYRKGAGMLSSQTQTTGFHAGLWFIYGVLKLLSAVLICLWFGKGMGNTGPGQAVLADGGGHLLWWARGSLAGMGSSRVKQPLSGHSIQTALTCTIASSLQHWAHSHQVQRCSLKLLSGASGPSSLSSPYVNHLVLGAIQVCNLDSPNSFSLGPHHILQSQNVCDPGHPWYMRSDICKCDKSAWKFVVLITEKTDCALVF